jgi:hypothetical protein
MADKSNMAKYASCMKKSVLGLAISLMLSLVAVTPSSAVEFGADATGDPTAVKVRGASGFLYSERIVITVAHIFGNNYNETLRSISNFEREGVIYSPGIVTIAGQKGYRVKKILFPSTFVYPDYMNNLITDDLAIVVLSEDIPVTKKAVLATEEQMKRFAREKSKVELVGYGITDFSQRDSLSPINNRAPHKLTSTLLSPEEVLNFYRQYPNVDWRKINKPGVYGIVQHRELKQSHICDGDSGSVFFVEENNVRYVLGTTGLGLVNNNCQVPGRLSAFPSMSWIDPKSKLSSLIKEAEEIVAEDRRIEFAKAEEVRLAAELKAKQEAEARAEAEATAKADAEAKSKAEAEARAKAEADAKASASKNKKTISCVKGKLTKKVTAVSPKCPKGYKKKI